jgi:cephalosporin hydroxylase
MLDKKLISLSEIYSHHDYNFYEGHGDKGTCHSYIEEYERILEPYRYNSTIMEIGVYHGLSIRMWDKYFIDSNVIGVDIQDYSEKIPQLLKEGYNIIMHDATKESFLDEVKDYRFDIIIDDASHLMQDQLKTFELLKSKMKPGGIYIIEDIITDLDIFLPAINELHDNIEVIDKRHVKNRFDDILILLKF